MDGAKTYYRYYAGGANGICMPLQVRRLDVKEKE